MLRTLYGDIRERATFKNTGIWGKGVKKLVPFLFFMCDWLRQSLFCDGKIESITGVALNYFKPSFHRHVAYYIEHQLLWKKQRVH